MGEERELSHVSEGALIKATQSTRNAIGSARFARTMFGEDSEGRPEGAVGAVEDAAELLEYALNEIVDEWEARENDTAGSRLDSKDGGLDG